MRRFLRRLRKGLKTACLTAALTTCWHVGQAAKADISPLIQEGDEVTIKITGTVTPSTHDLSHLYLIYGVNVSYIHSIWSVKLGDFPAGQDGHFYAEMITNYLPYESIYWVAAGLYGDISSGQYIEGVNGVTLGVVATEGDSWSSHSWADEGLIFSQLLNDDQEFFSNGLYSLYPWYYADVSDLHESTTISLFDFSNASQNGQIQVNAVVVPEPVSIVLFGTGGMIIVYLRRRNK